MFDAGINRVKMLALCKGHGGFIMFSGDNSGDRLGVISQVMIEAQEIGAHGVDFVERTGAMLVLFAPIKYTIQIKDEML